MKDTKEESYIGKNLGKRWNHKSQSNSYLTVKDFDYIDSTNGSNGEEDGEVIFYWKGFLLNK